MSAVGYVYKFTNLVNGNYYIGSRCGKNKNYSGSGLIFRKAKENASQIRLKMSIKSKGSKKPWVSKRMAGGMNPSAKPIFFKGIFYSNIKEAMNSTQTSRYLILKEVQS